MTEYSRQDITNWILGAFAVNASKGNELQFACPVCDHGSCYFNVDKQVGFCHRAKCRTTFTMDEMIDEVGYPPELGGYNPVVAKPKVELTPMKLPDGATKIHWDDREVEVLATRGVTWEHIQQFDIRSDDTRLYVPVYEDGELRQYNSRRIDRSKPTEDWFNAGPKPYKYASGHPITHYFLGWEECKLWEDLVVVENTFVSMWLRHLHATATFGSHLSDTHIDKIKHSRIKKVTFLWDSGTEYASEKAVKKLRALGIECRVITLKGQPDDHSEKEIEEMLDERT